MLSWVTIGYGASLSGLAAAALTYAATRRATITVLALLAAVAGPLGWNAVLRATHAHEFFTDAPIAALPASWQDAGSGVCAFAAAAAMLGLGPLGRDGRRAITTEALAGLAAFLVDVYLY
jgi:NAD/NADP transhydrogenase alpha subunit